jgi:hypothetical protein
LLSECKKKNKARNITLTKVPDIAMPENGKFYLCTTTCTDFLRFKECCVFPTFVFEYVAFLPEYD